MNWESRCIRTGAAAVLLAGMLRLTASGFFAPLEQALEDPLLTSFLVYTQTGRVVIRTGAAAVLLAGMLRLTASGFFAPLEQALEDPLLTSFLVYTQTGRVVRLTPEPPPAPAISQTVPPAPSRPEEAEKLPVFSADDAARIAVTYQCDYQPDMGSLLEQELDWDLHTDQPSVLILHTHTCESYTRCPGDTYEESGICTPISPAC